MDDSGPRLRVPLFHRIDVDDTAVRESRYTSASPADVEEGVALLPASGADEAKELTMTADQPTVHRILVVEDHPVVRAGLRELIDAEPDLHICAESGTVTDALKLARQEQPELAIIDLSLPDGSGIDLIKRLKVLLPELRMLVCSMHDESLFAERAINVGAHGYVSKQASTEQVLEAIRKVLGGGTYLSAEMVQRVINGFAKQKEGAGSSIEDLSNRELEVFDLIGQGLATSKIATRLNLSVKTVETHREKIKRKLQLSTAGELVRRAVQWRMEQA
jgi:DNA-binding NarL/FixJ family response regulator